MGHARVGPGHGGLRRILPARILIARMPTLGVLASWVLAGIARSRLIGPLWILTAKILPARIPATGILPSRILLTSWITGGRILIRPVGPCLVGPRILAAILRGKRVSGIVSLPRRIPAIGVLSGGIPTGLIGILIPAASIMAGGIARSLSLPLDCV